MTKKPLVFQLLGKRVTFWSLVFLLLLTMMAIFAPQITHFSYEEQNIAERLQGPSLTHLLGTDPLGRDLYSRIVYGARMSLAVGFLTAVSALILGTCVGAIAGYSGGWIDAFFMRFVDIVSIFPAPLMAILLMLWFGRGFLGIFTALSVTSWVTQARLVRGQVLQVKEFPYIESARAMGLTDFQIVTRHVIPNILAPMIVSLTVQIPTNIMAESFLSFIGLGLQPPYSSWGTLANEGFRAIQSYPHLIIFPGGVLFATMLAFNYVGDGLNESLKLIDFDHKG